MRITDAIAQTGALREMQRSSDVSRPSKTQDSAKSGKTSDSVSISKQARQAPEAEKVSAHIKALPDIREDRIADVKAKIQSGYYDTAEFQDKLADKRLQEFGVNENPS